MDAAFITSLPSALPASRPRRSVCRATRPRMCEEPLSAAERTRRALAETKPLVKFRRETEYLDQDTSFTYTKGVDAGVDIWLVTGVLTFLVPIVGLLVGVATGFVDLTPR